MKRKLTPKLIESLPPETAVQDTGFGVPGIFCHLRLEVGRLRDGPPLRTWFIYYRSPTTGRRRNKSIGHYPAPRQDQGLGLRDARARAARIAGEIASGRDPFGPGRAAEDWRTFRVCLGRYVAHLSEEVDGVPRRRGWKQQRYVLESKALPAWADRDVLDITAEDALDLLSPIAETAPTVAYHLRSHLRMMWRYLIRIRLDRQLLVNPFLGLEVGRPGRTRNESLTPDQVRDLWRTLEAEIDDGIASGEVDRAVRAAAVELAVLTGLRRGEVLKSRWSELRTIDSADLAERPRLARGVDPETVLGEWLEIPAHRFDEAGTYIGSTKGRTKPAPKDAFLGTVAGRAWIERLRRVHRSGGYDESDWMFPSPKTGRWREDFDDAVWRGLKERSGIPRLRWHLLRHTVASLLDEIGYDEADVGRVLGHAAQEGSAARVTRGYIHRRRLTTMARIAPIYSDWHAFLLELTADRGGTD